MKFNFKSAGTKISNKKFSVQDPQALARSIGIKTPLEAGDERSELFKMHIDPIEQIADNLRNLIQTNSGERLGRFEIGCNLKALVFDRNSNLKADYEKIAIENIHNQVLKYLPMISIGNIDLSVDTRKQTFEKTSLSKVIVKVFFSVPKLKRLNNSIEVILYNGG